MMSRICPEALHWNKNSQNHYILLIPVWATTMHFISSSTNNLNRPRLCSECFRDSLAIAPYRDGPEQRPRSQTPIPPRLPQKAVQRGAPGPGKQALPKALLQPAPVHVPSWAGVVADVPARARSTAASALLPTSAACAGSQASSPSTTSTSSAGGRPGQRA